MDAIPPHPSFLSNLSVEREGALGDRGLLLCEGRKLWIMLCLQLSKLSGTCVSDDL